MTIEQLKRIGLTEINETLTTKMGLYYCKAINGNIHIVNNDNRNTILKKIYDKGIELGKEIRSQEIKTLLNIKR